MADKSYMQLADEILGGALTDPVKAEVTPLGETQEELPELTDAAHTALMSHILTEDLSGKKHAEKVSRQAGSPMPRFASLQQKKSQKPAQKIKQKIGTGLGAYKRHTRLAAKTIKRGVERGLRNVGYGGGEGARGPHYKQPKQLKLPFKGALKDHMENLNKDQIEILKQAKEIVSEMTTVGALGVSHARKSGGHHPALKVKLPGDKDQAAQIKAASTPPVYKAEAAKLPAPSGKINKRVIVKRRSAQSKDDETQGRVHNDMKSMYHESFDAFVDGILLNEDYTGKGYKGDVSVAEFGRKGPANNTFGGGGVKTGGRGPKVKVTKNQLMTAKKKGKGSDKDHETPGFGNASSHSRKHPQNPYAGSK